VPIAAFAVGEIGVHRRVVEENDFLARVAFIVFCSPRRAAHLQLRSHCLG
jgi:hypothetical protein